MTVLDAPNQDIRAAALAREGKTAPQIAGQLEVSVEQARAAVARGRAQLNTGSAGPTAVPRTVSPAGAPPTAAQSGVMELLAWAQDDPGAPPKARTIADRVREQLGELRTLRLHADVIARAQSEIDDLEKQLADARAQMLQITGQLTQPVSREERMRIRAWARENGHTIGSAGVLPQTILAAYTASRAGGAS